MSTSSATHQSCVHCGQPCEDQAVQKDELSFCCQGCCMVYQVLQDNGLMQFYDMAQQPGFSLKERMEEDYRYLDEEEVRKLFLDFSDGHTARVHFSLPQIHCVSCIWLLEQLGRLNEHVLRSKVNFLKKEAHIVFDESQLPLSALVKLLATIGYAPDIRLVDAERTARPAIDRSMYLKLGVSGFLFGNIMLFSFPEYLGLELAADDFWRRCFAYLNLLLSIPLLLYSAREYLQSAWWGLKQWRATIDLPIAIGILALFGRSAYEVLSHTGAGYFDSLAGLLFFLLIGKWFQQQFYHRLSFDRDYKSYFPLAASVIGPNGIQQLPLDQLEVGQRLLIREGQLIPSDSRLLKGRAEIDYSFVTGESRPIRVEEGALVYAGGRQRGMAIELEMVKKTHQSYLVQLWNEKTFQQKEGHQNMERLIQKVGRVFTLAIVLIALATLTFWLVTDASLALNAFTAVLIIACPCAVALSIPFAFGNALRLMARRGYMLKNTDSLEQMQELTHLVFDKTGTLTESESSHWVCQGELSETERVWLRSLVHHSAHPVSRRIEEWLGKGLKQGIENFRESIGQGIEGRVDGRWLRLGSSVFVGGDARQTGTYFMVDGEQRAVFESESSVRPGIHELLHQLEGRYELSLLSGDDEREAAAFRRLLGPEAHLLFRQSPTDKLRYVERLQDAGERVMMIGDGLNDAGALQQADLGLVVSDRNNNFSPACDAIVEGDRLQYLAKELQYARRVRWVVYISFGLALIYNFIGLGFAVQALLSPVVAAILMPASSLTIAAWGMLGSWLVCHFSKADENHLSP